MGDAVDMKLFKPLLVGNNNVYVSYFLYANNVMFVGYGSKENANNLVTILKCFYEVSGLQINFHKSKMYGLGMKEEEVHKFARVAGCTTEPIPFKYLGVPVGAYMNHIGAYMNHIKSWEPIIDKFKSKLNE